MRYNSIKDFDIKQGDGVNVSLWTQGCSHKCKGCHNVETWNFKGGKKFTEDTINFIIELLTKDNIPKNLSILGGEPLEKVNFKMLQKLIEEVKNKTNAKIWIWTGYTLRELEKINDKNLIFILNNIDYLIDGKFDASKKIDARYFGSSNQRLIDMKHRLTY